MEAEDHLVTFYPSFEKRIIVLQEVISEHYVVPLILLKEAMADKTRRDAFKRVYTQWKNERGFYVKRTVFEGLGVPMSGLRAAEIHIDTELKEDLWGEYGPSADAQLSTWGNAEVTDLPFGNEIFFNAAMDAFGEFAVGNDICLKAYHIAWTILVIDYGLSKVKKSTMNLTNSHRKNTRWVASIRRAVKQAVTDHFSHVNPVYDPRMKGFKWGNFGLFVHESGFEEGATAGRGGEEPQQGEDQGNHSREGRRGTKAGKGAGEPQQGREERNHSRERSRGTTAGKGGEEPQQGEEQGNHSREGRRGTIAGRGAWEPQLEREERNHSKEGSRGAAAGKGGEEPQQGGEQGNHSREGRRGTTAGRGAGEPQQGREERSHSREGSRGTTAGKGGEEPRPGREERSISKERCAGVTAGRGAH
ncbi:unnamed protein product [Closterium sp. NIES-64]|nr:unnamed protein product [Closterium sp. NIES-64]